MNWAPHSLVIVAVGLAFQQKKYLTFPLYWLIGAPNFLCNSHILSHSYSIHMDSDDFMPNVGYLLDCFMQRLSSICSSSGGLLRLLRCIMHFGFCYWTYLPSQFFIYVCEKVSMGHVWWALWLWAGLALSTVHCILCRLGSHGNQCLVGPCRGVRLGEPDSPRIIIGCRPVRRSYCSAPWLFWKQMIMVQEHVVSWFVLCSHHSHLRISGFFNCVQKLQQMLGQCRRSTRGAFTQLFWNWLRST